MTDTLTGHKDGPVPPTARRSGVGGWAAAALAAFVGAVLGMAVGHWSVWQTAEPLPTDDRAREIAGQFVPDGSGTLSRSGEDWSGEPAGWRGFLFGYRSVDDAQISITFPPDSRTPAERYAYAEALADRLRRAGWQVDLDPSYPALRAHHAGLAVGYGPRLAPPVEDPSGAVLEQEVLGTEVTIRRDTPASAPLGLALGGLLGGGLAVLAVTVARRRLRSRGAATRRAVLILSGVGTAGLAPGTLVALGLLYLFLTEPSPQEPLLTAYSLPITRPAALLGAGCLAAAVGALLVGPKARVSPAGGRG